MEDEVTAPRETAFFGGRAARWLGGALLAGLAVIAALGISARRNVEALEQFEEVSGVNDTAYFKRPEAVPKPPAAVAHLNGAPLFLVSVEKIEIRDTKLVRLGHDAATGLTIYKTRAPLDGKRHDPRDFFLKVGRNDYVRVRGEK